MARAFNLVVFDGTISGNNAAPPEFYSSQEHAALLGSVERLQFQLIVRAVSDFTNPADIQTTYEITNAPEYDAWAESTVKPIDSVTAIGDLPAVFLHQVSNFQDQAAYGRFKLKCTTDNIVVHVQLVVAGYAD